MSVRKEVAEYCRVCDILLNGISLPLTQTELQLLNAYTERIEEKFRLQELPPASVS
jgi:hypothetical protein